MKPNKKASLLFLVVLWCLFFLGEYYLATLPNSGLASEIRYDLFVVPLLVVFSIYLIYEQLKSH